MSTLTKTTTMNLNNNNYTTNILVKLNLVLNHNTTHCFFHYVMVLHAFNHNFTPCYVLIMYLCKAPLKQ